MKTLTHPQFGIGTLVSNDEKTVTVNFNGTERKLFIKFASLKKDGSDWKPAKIKKEKTVKVQFTGITDEQEFGGQIWFEAAKEQSDIDCLIEAKLDEINDKKLGLI
jgi:hypothetical protein